MARSRLEDHTTSLASHAVVVIAVAAAMALLFLATPLTAFGDSLAEDDEICLSCHSAEGVEKDLANGEVLPLHIRGNAFADSVHAWAGCTGCHASVDLDTHPGEMRIESRHAFSVAASAVCSECHPGASLEEGPAHHARTAVAGGPACAECHDVHAITPVSEWKEGIPETAYCLTCHGKALSMQLDSGEVFTLSVNEAGLRGSVHLDHDCTDCHAGFSKTAHEAASFRTTRDHVIARAEVCQQCHGDKSEQYRESIHAALIEDGNQAAPVCSDCHGSHSIRPKAVFETVSGVPCRKCHENIFEAYLGSMHGQARSVQGHFDAPICADCHRAHEIGAAAVGNQLREACLGCHPEAPDAHREWLPNSALHLEVVSCPACHAPRAQRRVDLTLFDDAAQAPFAEAANTPQFDAVIRSADTEGDGLDAIELWNLVRELNRDGTATDLTLQGRIEVRAGVDAHRLAGKAGAVRDCASCHQQNADPFQTVTVSIVGHDGRPIHYDADKEVLNSVVSVDSVSGFYAIGGTRIKLLDVLLVFAFLGGISVPAGHLTLKWLFRTYRKRAQRNGMSAES